MKTQLNLSIDIDTAQQVEEMRKRGTNPSALFIGIMKALKKNDYKYPVTYEPETAIEDK